MESKIHTLTTTTRFRCVHGFTPLQKLLARVNDKYQQALFAYTNTHKDYSDFMIDAGNTNFILFHKQNKREFSHKVRKLLRLKTHRDLCVRGTMHVVYDDYAMYVMVNGFEHEMAISGMLGDVMCLKRMGQLI